MAVFRAVCVRCDWRNQRRAKERTVLPDVTVAAARESTAARVFWAPCSSVSKRPELSSPTATARLTVLLHAFPPE